MCSAAASAGLRRPSFSLAHHVVLLAGLLAVCIVAITQLPPLHVTAGVLSEAVSSKQPGMSIGLQSLPCHHPEDNPNIPKHTELHSARKHTSEPNSQPAVDATHPTPIHMPSLLLQP